MAFEWTTIRAADFIEFNPRLSIKKNAIATKVAMDKLQPFTKKNSCNRAGRIRWRIKVLQWRYHNGADYALP